MDNYDLLTIKREQLHFLLNTAKDEIAKYNRCCREMELCAINPTGEDGFTIVIKICCAYIAFAIIWFLVFAIIVLCTGGDAPISNASVIISTIISVLISIFLGWQRRANKVKNREKNKERLQDLQKEKEEAINEFKATLFIPDDYRYEYALTTMLKFINNKRACNWKEVVNLYEEHLHRMTMEEKAQQTLEQSMLQTELAKGTRDAAQWAAAGALASAAGIWLKRDKNSQGEI